MKSSKTDCQDFSEISVLVIDDEKRIRNACLTMLNQDGYSADEAENMEIGLQRLAEQHFDIILLDLMMPGISGLEGLASIRALDPDTVVIVITGYATVEHSIEAMKNGAFDFIAKPFSPNDLRTVLVKAVEFTQTLQDLANEKSRIKALVNHLADGVLATNMNKCIALVNPAFLKLTGCQGNDQFKDCIGKPVEDVIHVEEIRQMIVDALVLPADDHGGLIREVSIEDTTYLRVRCIPFRDRPGRLLGVVTVVNDITSLIMMDQLKSNFVHMVSHEIRSPLNSVLMQIKVVTDRLAGDLTDKQDQIMNRVAERVKGLVNLSTELLDLSKIESGSVGAKKEAIDISELLVEEVNFNIPKAREKSIDLTLTPLPSLPKVVINRMGIVEVVSNLINNAINYTSNGGKIDVYAESNGDFLTIHVKDTGIGIPETELERIFDRFYRVKNRDTRYIVGTGLGLAIVKSIVQAHQGQVEVESIEGQGSRFTVNLPLG
jgi:signal transduction histidine kinase/FixJ family two-component response regulator